MYTVDYSDQSPRGGASLGCIKLTMVTGPLMEVVLWYLYS